MKKPARVALVVGFLVGMGVALAAPPAGTAMSGTSPQTLTLSEGSSILAQCRGQIVTVRGMTSAEVHDAGLKDIAVDFITNPDAVPLHLSAGQSKLGFMNFDAGSLDCVYAPNR